MVPILSIFLLLWMKCVYKLSTFYGFGLIHLYLVACQENQKIRKISRKWRNLAKNQAKLWTIDRFSWWSGKYQRNLFQIFDKIFSHQLAFSNWPCWKILLCTCLHPFLTFSGLDIPLILVGIHSWHTSSLGHKYIVLFYQFFFILNFWKAVVFCDLKISRSWCEIW